MPWAPGDPWPSATEGGASSPHWGGYVRLWLRAALAAGNTFHLGPHTYAKLDNGNVLGGAPVVGRAGTLSRLWVDMSCDVLDLQIAGGASSNQGMLSKPDAATITVTLADPEGKYDPLSRGGPFSYGGRSRLVPGTPIECFAEVADPSGAWTRHALFTGTADSWGEDWTPNPARRQARLIATDVTKAWVKLDRPEQSPQGAGDTTAQRVQRLVTFYGWIGTIEPAPSSTVTLAATTLAATGWELLNRTLDDELGYVYFTPEGNLRWLNRDAWTDIADPVLELGCDDIDPALHDVLLDASPSTIDYQMKNTVYAARTGGTTRTATAPSSIERYGVYDYTRTDLGVQTDDQAGAWAQALLVASAFPQVTLDDVTFRAAIDPSSWDLYRSALELEYVSDLVRIAWAPPDRPDAVIDGLARVVGHSHTITRRAWETKWVLVAAQPLKLAGVIFTIGPHAQDRLDAGYVLGLA
jgi:hypothetical protein